MALSNETKRRITVALADRAAGDEVIARLEAAIGVAKFGATANVRVDTLANLGADTESRLDAIEAKLNALITALSA